MQESNYERAWPPGAIEYLGEQVRKQPEREQVLADCVVAALIGARDEIADVKRDHKSELDELAKKLRVVDDHSRRHQTWWNEERQKGEVLLVKLRTIFGKLRDVAEAGGNLVPVLDEIQGVLDD